MGSRDSYPMLSPTTTNTMSEPFSNSILSSSITSISSTASRHTSQVSKTYRQASTLFLTRRLPESLSTLLPLITPPEPAENGDPAPVARSSRTTRIKVWSLYLTIMNAIIELEPEEGKDAFGAQDWKALCSKVREGQIWEDVVKNGYHGIEGDVDSDVIINLATLLLAHARDQSLNQRRLETYLAASNSPTLDIAGKLGSQPQSPGPRLSRYRSPSKGTSGANTPRDLNARVKILELYTLHVLLRNNEWEYAREFISVNSVLDEERREAFLQALQSLQEEQQEQERLELEERQRQETQLRQDMEEARRLRTQNEEREKRRLEEERLKREGSEVDYGIEQTPNSARSSNSRLSKPSPTHRTAAQSANSRHNGKPSGPLTLTARASMIMSRFRAIIDELSIALNSNPIVLTRFLVFIAGLLLMLGNKGLRQRVNRVLGASWGKIKATAGMGTKVSYI